MRIIAILRGWWSTTVVATRLVAGLAAGFPLAVSAQPCRSPACTIQIPNDAGALNVRDFGAKGDGKTDDTAAILAAIAASGDDTGVSWWHDRIVYMPAGTYLISDSLLKRYANGLFASGLALLGEGPERTIIRLADHAGGFQNAGAPRGIVMTTSKLIDRSPNRDYANKGEGNDAYENFIENLTIDAGEGNPGAIGIDYLANNLGAIRNTVIQAHGDSGAIGISILRKFPGPALIQATQIRGFRTGIAIDQGVYGMTLSNIQLDDQVETGLRNGGNIVSAEHLKIRGAGKAGIRNVGPGGLITLVDSEIGESVINRGTIVFRDTRATLSDFTSSTKLNGVLRGDGGFQPSAPSWSVPRVTIATVDAGPSRNWVGVSGSTEEVPVDSTQALQRALNSGAHTIYLQHGTFWISAMLKIPASVHRIFGMNSTLRVFPQRQPGFARDQPILLVEEPGGPLEIDHLGMDGKLGGQLGIRLTSSRPLLLRDILSFSLAMLDRADSGGNVALENVCCGTLRIAGPAPVTARQFNTVGGGVRITDSGAPLSIVGLKTEQESTVAVTTDGGRTDVLGGLVFMVGAPSPNDRPVFITRDSKLFAAFIEVVLVRGHGYRVYLRSEDAGVVKEIEANTMQARGMGHIVTALQTGSP